MKKYIMPLSITALLLFLFYAPLLFSDEKVELEFPHAVHVDDNEMACLDCHAAAETSESGTDNLNPDPEMCLDCHEADEIPGYDKMRPITDYSAKFSHKLHLESGENCESCHANVLMQEISYPADLPTMVECMDCHESKFVMGDCQTCHMQGENLVPASHVLDFNRNHALLARISEKETSANMNCNSCHQQSFCQECHEGDNVNRVSHPLNYEFTHALDAINKEINCTSCHVDRQFCSDCHAENNLMPFNHTVGWVNNIPGDGGRHSIEAMTDLENCASCHESDAEIVCQPCHGN